MPDETQNPDVEQTTDDSTSTTSEGTGEGTTTTTDPETPSTEEKLEQLQKDFDDLSLDYDKSKETIKELESSIEGYQTTNKKLSDDNVEFRTLLEEAKKLDAFQDEQLSNYQKQILTLQDEIENDESQTSLLSTISDTTQTIAETTNYVMAGSGTVVYYGVYIIPLILFIVFVNWFLKPFITPYR